MKNNFPFRPYQAAAVSDITSRFLDKNERGHLLADDMGLGKALQALAVLDNIIAVDRKYGRALVICPGFLCLNWFVEIKKWLPGCEYIIEVIGYRQAVTQFRRLTRDNYDLIILDEGHYLKSFESQRTQAIFRAPGNQFTPIVGRSKRILNVTGTPIPTRIGDIYPYLYQVKHPAIKGMTYADFVFKYAAKAKYLKTGLWHTGVKNTETLRKILRSGMTRRLIEDVEKELPPTSETSIPLELSKEMLREHETDIKELLRIAGYSKVEADFLQENDDLLIQILTHSPSFQELSGMRRKQALFKIPQVVNYLKEQVVPTLKKFILVCYHIDVATEYYKQLRDLPANVTLITGNIPGAERFNIVMQADKDEEHILIVTMSSIAEGLNLTGFAYMYFAEICWPAHLIDQVKRRIYRIGQTKPVFWFFFLLDSGVERLMNKSVKSKRQMYTELLN